MQSIMPSIRIISGKIGGRNLKTSDNKNLILFSVLLYNKLMIHDSFVDGAAVPVTWSLAKLWVTLCFTPLPNIMKKGTGHDKIYMSIDHLKSGKYQLNILLENKVVQTLEIKKEETKRLKK